MLLIKADKLKLFPFMIIDLILVTNICWLKLIIGFVWSVFSSYWFNFVRAWPLWYVEAASKLPRPVQTCHEAAILGREVTLL